MKNIYCIVLFIAATFFLFSNAHSQMLGRDSTYRLGEYYFQSKFDTSEYTTKLVISFKKKIIYENSFGNEITDIREYVINKNLEKVVFIDLYSGGAHCCSFLLVGKIINNKFKVLDSLWWGNSGYDVQDIDNDGTLEIEGGKDMFAYAFTNYSETRFPPVIYRFENDRLVDATSRYPYIIKEDIKQLKKDLKEFTDKGFECMGIDDDTFNTDAGSVKTILSAIVADYKVLGEVSKGYDFVKSAYKCADRDKFIKILRDEFKLK
jgi:hypothetical protein